MIKELNCMTSDLRVQVLRDGAQSTFTTPKDVNAEAVYQTPDKRSNGSPNQSTTALSECQHSMSVDILLLPDS